MTNVLVPVINVSCRLFLRRAPTQGPTSSWTGVAVVGPPRSGCFHQVVSHEDSFVVMTGVDSLVLLF